jgi:hypothetical protein
MTHHILDKIKTELNDRYRVLEEKEKEIILREE